MTVKTYRLLGEGVETGCSDFGVPVATQVVLAKGVGHDPNDVHCGFCFRFIR